MSHTIYDADILANGECENKWKGFRDSCYLFVLDLLDWHDAQVKQEPTIICFFVCIVSYTYFYNIRVNWSVPLYILFFAGNFNFNFLETCMDSKKSL
jgi:hypothetical protein